MQLTYCVTHGALHGAEMRGEPLLSEHHFSAPASLLFVDYFYWILTCHWEMLQRDNELGHFLLHFSLLLLLNLYE